MTGAAVIFAVTFGVVRHLSATMTVPEMVFFRGAFGVVAMLPWLARAGPGALRTRRPKAYAIRALAFYAGFMCWFYGLAHMKLADATALYFTTPLFTVVLASWVLKERVGRHRWAAIIAGFAGAVIIVRPGAVELGLPVAAVLMAAVMFGVANVTVRALVKTERPSVVVFYDFALQMPLALGPAIYFWGYPGAQELVWLFVLGVVSAASQQCFARALAAAPTAAVMPPFYLQLPFVAAIGLVWFGQVPDGWVWLGAAVVGVASYYVAWRESRLAPGR